MRLAEGLKPAARGLDLDCKGFAIGAAAGAAAGFAALGGTVFAALGGTVFAGLFDGIEVGGVKVGFDVTALLDVSIFLLPAPTDAFFLTTDSFFLSRFC